MCRKNGHDRHGDNLKHFTDGGKHCFACGYHVFPPNQKRITRINNTYIDTPKYEYSIPEDSSTAINGIGIDWLNYYHFTLNDIIRNKILWSDKFQWLIFPIEHNNQIVGFQARNFNTNKPYKWYSKFPKGDIIKLFKGNDEVVIVEDIVSAIRLHTTGVSVIPLFGSHINNDLVQFLRSSSFSKVFVWLDRDKATSAVKYSALLRSNGINSHTIVTKLDPKLYSKKELLCYLQK